MARTKRGFVNKEVVLKKLQDGRSGAVQVCTEAKIGSPEYIAANKMIEATDSLAKELTGDREYFWMKPHG